MKKVDYLMVGQGIAGTVLAHTLEDANLDFHIIHQYKEGQSSSVAAGIINPITGKNFVKSWQIDLLLPFAKKKYELWEQKLKAKFYYPRNVFRAIHSVSEQNDWLAKTADPSVKHYISAYLDKTPFDWLNNAPLGYGQTTGGGQVLWNEFLMLSQKYWEEKGQYTSTHFDYSEMKISPKGIQFREYLAEKVIFCEGYFMLQNPWFNYLPLDGAKGEAKLLQFDHKPLDTILKHKIFLAPYSEGTLWAGATNMWEFSNFLPEPEMEVFLEAEISKMLKVPTSDMKHLVGIRPTVKDRRPLIGFHPKFPQLLIFNGLGTKGTSLAPYWASQLLEFLTDKKPISKEVNISRFSFK